MKKIQEVEMLEREHCLYGLGNLNYRYLTNKVSKELVITIDAIDTKLYYKGKKAENIYRKIISDADETVINQIKRLACDAVGIPLIRIKQKSRKKELVFARACVFWYLRKYLQYTWDECGAIFDKDHATSIHGYNLFNSLNIYLSDEQQIWKNRFLKNIKNSNLHGQIR